MSTENQTLLLKDLSFSDLYSLYNFFDQLTPSFNIEPDAVTDVHKYAIQEKAYLERYIAGKYGKVKKDSTAAAQPKK